MPTAYVQTQEFLGLIEYEGKLVNLYKKIKKMTEENKLLTNKIEYMKFRSEALEISLLDQQKKLNKSQSRHNEQLLKDLISLEQIIEKQSSEINDEEITSCRQAQQIKQMKQTTNREEETLREFKQVDTNRKMQNKEGTKMKSDEMEQIVQRLNENQKNMGKLRKDKKILEVENRRLRKINEEYSIKIKKFERLEEARSRVYASRQQSQKSVGFSQFSGSAL